MCIVENCDQPIYVKSLKLCTRHYNRLRTTGTTEDGPRARASLEERFWRYVDKRGVNECWPWTSKSQVEGYGTIGLGGRGTKKILSHRASWIIHYGEIPESDNYHGTVVRHICDNRLCCNPKHLRLGTQADNVKDMWDRSLIKGNAKFTEDEVRMIRASNKPTRYFVNKYNVHRSCIKDIRAKRTWKHIE